jgi:hypothetical protein
MKSQWQQPYILTFGNQLGKQLRMLFYAARITRFSANLRRSLDIVAQWGVNHVP